MALTVNPINFHLPMLANPWIGSAFVSGAPIQPGLVRLNSVTPIRPVAPALPIRHRSVPLTRFLATTQFTTWRQIIGGRHATPHFTQGRQTTQLRSRSGSKTPIKRLPSNPPHRPEIPAGHRRPPLKVPLSDRPLPRVPERQLATDRDAILTRENGGAIQPPSQKLRRPSESPAIEISEPISSPIGDKSPRPSLTKTISLHDEIPVGANTRFAPTNDPISEINETLTFDTIQSTPPAIDRSRLWDFQVAKVLFESKIKTPTITTPDSPKIVPFPATPRSDVNISASVPNRLSNPEATRASDAPAETSTIQRIDSDTDSELAGLANILPALQELKETRLGPWTKQILTSPSRAKSATLSHFLQETIRSTIALKQKQSPYAALKAELARIDGELRVTPLPHILPNMGELNRETLLGVFNQAGANSQDAEQTENGPWDPELVKQVRQEISAAGYLDEQAGHIRKFNNAEDGKAFLHFLSHLARKKLSHYGLSLINLINLINDKIGYGPFLKQKDINGTIRSMDPKRWGKDSEVLLHPLMGRANLVINVLDLIENNRITMPEVLDLLRIGTDGDILERLAVELEAAQIYRNDPQWWQEIWKGQDAEALKPWFDDLLAQIRGAITDLKDVLAFVSSLETTPADDNAISESLSA